MEYTLSQAAEETGKSKSTIFRAVKKGKLSSRQDAQGVLWVDASEVERWNSGVQQARGDETPRRDAVTREEAPDMARAMMDELIALRVENAALREAVARERDRADRDHDALMLTLRSLPPPEQPKPEPPPEAKPAPVTEPPRGWMARVLGR